MLYLAILPSSVQLLSCVWLFLTLWTAAHQAFLFKFMSVESVMPSNRLILCCPLFLPTTVFPSIRVFSNQLVLCIRWPNIGASASVLPVKVQGWFPLGLTGLILQSKGLSRWFFIQHTVWKHQLFGAQPSLGSNSQICTWLLEKPYLWLYGPLLAEWCLYFLICCLGLS